MEITLELVVVVTIAILLGYLIGRYYRQPIMSDAQWRSYMDSLYPAFKQFEFDVENGEEINTGDSLIVLDVLVNYGPAHRIHQHKKFTKFKVRKIIKTKVNDINEELTKPLVSTGDFIGLNKTRKSVKKRQGFNINASGISLDGMDLKVESENQLLETISSSVENLLVHNKMTRKEKIKNIIDSISSLDGVKEVEIEGDNVSVTFETAAILDINIPVDFKPVSTSQKLTTVPKANKYNSSKNKSSRKSVQDK